MGLFDGILGIFGKKEEAGKRPGNVADRGEKKKLAKQVYPSTFDQVPEWAANLDQSHVIAACMQHIACKFTPHIEVKKIMSTRTGLDGNLEPEYEGIACDCGAIKTYGKQVAQRDGYMQPYRYVNLGHIYACCCDKPRKCTFYSLAVGHDMDVSKRQKRVG